MNEYLFFWGGPFSNFYPINNNQSITSEKFYMLMKAVAFHDYESITLISNSTTPRDAKKLGRAVKNYDQKVWDEIKFSVMMSAIRLKVAIDEDFKDILRASENKILVEASPVDRIWGIGYHKNEALDNILDWGENLLGKALMNIRAELYLKENLC